MDWESEALVFQVNAGRTKRRERVDGEAQSESRRDAVSGCPLGSEEHNIRAPRIRILVLWAYGYRPDGSKHPIPIDRGGICEVSEEEAQRLFALCVARPAEETPSPAVATPSTGEDGSGAGADPSNSGEGAEGAESAHLDPEQLKTLTNAKLTELAKEMGIDTAKLKTKAQLIAAITDVPLEDAIAEDDDGVDDGEAPPVLTPEAPVV
jgi:hypothetical protein